MEERHVNPEDGIQFATDLRRIREARGLSLQQLHESTRIEPGILRSFERNALFDHPVFNRVYLRSFVKTYAELVGIDAEEALGALERAMAGMYRGQIGKDFFGEVQLPDGESLDPEASEQTRAGPTTRADDSEPGPQSDRGSGGAEVDELSRSTQVSSSATMASDSEPSGEAASASGDPDSPDTPVTISSTPATDIPLPVPGSAPPTGMVVRPSVVRRIFAIAVTLAVIVVAIMLVRSLLGDADSSARSESSTTGTSPGALVSANGSDRTGAAETGESSPPAVPDVDGGTTDQPATGIQTLPDTVEVQLRALSGPVRGIRIRVDNDLRRPYWIEADSILSIEMAGRMIVEEHAGAVSISVPSINYEAEPLIAGYPFVLSRTKLDQFLASASRYRAGSDQ